LVSAPTPKRSFSFPVAAGDDRRSLRQNGSRFPCPERRERPRDELLIIQEAVSFARRLSIINITFDDKR
jgi:hypothetical protein